MFVGMGVHMYENINKKIKGKIEKRGNPFFTDSGIDFSASLILNSRFYIFRKLYLKSLLSELRDNKLREVSSLENETVL